MKRVAVDIWSDVVCPFCYIGKRRLEHAAKESNIALDVTWHSFELDPNAPERNAKSETEHLSRKYGRTEAQAIAMQQDVEKLAAGEGITYNWAKSKSGNSFNAHRIIHLAQTKGLGDAAEEAFFKAYMTDGLAVGERPTVEDIAVRTIGLDAAEVKSVLDSNTFADAVRSDESRARNELRLSGVPYFLFEGGAASLSGAQSREAFARALKQVAANKKVTPVSDNAGVPLCTGDSCKLPQ